ncbi:MAG: helix-turn-helix transcriptional regulator [Clostridiaceae bacterium]|nr:helix-turn-helix transcriptional regulator [Clostridiaceae bacterium]
MELNEKLQELRKQKQLTQEELAEILFVSRTAISKWESGRGYPSIESLKAMSKFFSISVDELLSGEELINVAEKDSQSKIQHMRDLIFGLLDCAIAMFLFLPFFGQREGDFIRQVSLFSLTEAQWFIKAAYLTVVLLTIVLGITTLALQNYHGVIWTKRKGDVSVLLSMFGVFIFMASFQPYAAFFIFVFLIIKGIFLIKR